MNYPLISEYIEAIRNAEDNFDKLSHLRPVYDSDGDPIMNSGNYAVVFKMTDGIKNYAIKCFIREQEGRDAAYKLIAEELEKVNSPYLVHFQYYERELYVYTAQNSLTEFPVLLMDWIDGTPLDIYIRKNINNDDKLRRIKYKFVFFIHWLLDQSFAHGDLKPDNIMVKNDGSIIVLDYDGMYVPAMRGQKAREIGSPDYSHPKRTLNDFDKHIDDFSAIIITTILTAITIDKKLINCYNESTLMFSAKDYLNYNQGVIMKLLDYSYNREIAQLLGCLILVHSNGEINRQLYDTLYDLVKKDFFAILDNYPEELFHNEIPQDTLSKYYVDENGVIYSHDKKILYRYPIDSTAEKYIINSECIAISRYAFEVYEDGVEYEAGIGQSWLVGNDYIKEIILPPKLQCIGTGAFWGCCAMEKLVLPEKIKYIEKEVFWNGQIKELTIPSGIQYIGENAFGECVFRVYMNKNNTHLYHITEQKGVNGLYWNLSGFSEKYYLEKEEDEYYVFIRDKFWYELQQEKDYTKCINPFAIDTQFDLPF